MMIPVRVPVDASLHTVGGVRHVGADHPMNHMHCPACGGHIADEPITLVFVGIHPEGRKESGWTTGGAVAVHAACAGLAAEATSEAGESPVTAADGRADAATDIRDRIAVAVKGAYGQLRTVDDDGERYTYYALGTEQEITAAVVAVVQPELEQLRAALATEERACAERGQWLANVDAALTRAGQDEGGGYIAYPRRVDQLAAERDRLAETLRQVLDAITHGGNIGGEYCQRTGWIPADRVAQWRAVLASAAPRPADAPPTAAGTPQRDRSVESVRCPRCDAQPGKQCRALRLDAWVPVAPHSERHEALTAQTLGNGCPAACAEQHTYDSGCLLDPTQFPDDTGAISFTRDPEYGPWVWRCWGTDTCDGWLSFNHTSAAAARRAYDRHARDKHEPKQPPAEPLQSAVETAAEGQRP